MERHEHAVVNFLSHLGQVWGYASHKPELLTTSMMVFGRERPTFGDETISTASYCFQVFCSCQHRTTGVLSEFLWIFGVHLDILCIKWVFNAFMCIIQIWTTCACSSAYKLVENQICVLGCMLRSHARNGNQFQTSGRRGSAGKIEKFGFLIPVNPKHA